MTPTQMMLSIVGGIGFALAGVCAFAWLRYRQRIAQVVGGLAAGVSLAAIVVYLIYTAAVTGKITAVQNSYGSTLLLVGLVGLVGLGVHWSTTMRGLEVMLFALAALFSLASLGTSPEPDLETMHQPWFISHTLAFALSLACFAVSAVAGMAYILVYMSLRKKKACALLGFFGPLESLERLGRWSLITGFPLFTYGLLTGLCGMAHERGGGLLGWNNPFTWYSLFAFVLYAFMVICIWFVPRIRGRRAAGMALAGVALIVGGLVVVELLAPLHR
jgi:ABC-type uncharacterized transport system permease subunit